MHLNPILHESWKKVLLGEFSKPYMAHLKTFLVEEKQHYTLYPRGNHIFNAFNSTPFDAVKAVILGQDPYHGTGQAHGLSFSVPQGIKIPPSLHNIFKELVEDMGCDYPRCGDLSQWASEGVLLLNTVLTVRAGEPFSHKEQGWEQFTDEVIRILSDQRDHLVFILWGAPAQKKSALIDSRKHRILKAPHPSPLSAYRGFLGSKPFSQTNAYLTNWGITPIHWVLA